MDKLKISIIIPMNESVLLADTNCNKVQTITHKKDNFISSNTILKKVNFQQLGAILIRTFSSMSMQNSPQGSEEAANIPKEITGPKEITRGNNR